MNYSLLASKYDELTYDVDYSKMLEFYEQIFYKNNLAVNNILELGCGTGNITQKLFGYNVFAIDNSDEMLAVARNKIQRRNVSFFNMDIKEFELNKRFDACIAALDVINYIVDEEDLESVFNNVYKHLMNDSVFIMDLNSKYKIKEYIGNNIFTDEIDGLVYIWQGNFDNKTNINDYLLTFFVRDSKGKYDRYSELHKEKAYDENYITKLLYKSGFDKIDIFDDFTMGEVRKDSMRISIVAYKKGETNE